MKSSAVNIILSIVLFVATLLTIQGIYQVESNANQVIVKEKLDELSNGISEIKGLTNKELDLLTKYYDLFKEEHIILERESLNIQEYIESHCTTIPTEVAILIATNTIKLCKEYNISSRLVIALMEVESSFDPYVISKVGARGLLQVRPSVWEKELGISTRNSLHNIETGIEFGIKILIIYLNNSNNNLTQALQKYNGAAGCTRFSSKVYAAMESFETFLDSSRKRG